MRTALTHCGLARYGKRRGRGWAWGRIGWLTGCRGSRACRRRPTNSCHAACVSRPLATHQARRTVMVAMQASRPAGQSGLSNDAMRWSECTGPAHPRLAVSVPSPAGSLTVSLLVHTLLPSFWAGIARRGPTQTAHTVILAQSYLPSTVLPIAPDPASDPASEPWKTRFGKELLPRVSTRPISGRVAIPMLTSITMPIVPCHSAGAGQHDASPHSSTLGRRPAQGKNPHGLFCSPHSMELPSQPATRVGATHKTRAIATY